MAKKKKDPPLADWKKPMRWFFIAFGLIWFLSQGIGPQAQNRQQGNTSRQPPAVTQRNQSTSPMYSPPRRAAQQATYRLPCKMAPTGPEQVYGPMDYLKGWKQPMKMGARNITPGGCEVGAARNTWVAIPGGFPVRGGYASRGAVPTPRTPSYYYRW